MRGYLEALAALLAAGLSGPARAGGGLVEINQSRAVAGGVTADDAPNFPVTINLPGSYLLTSNLAVTDPNVNAIEISSDDVSIDLGGFEIAGPVNCSGYGSAQTCGSGTGKGIAAASSANVRVHDGNVHGFGGDAVSLGDYAEVHRVWVTKNGGRGIAAGIGALISDSRADGNGGSGIDTGRASIVLRCVVEGSRGVGISGGVGALVSGSGSSYNGGQGILTDGGSADEGNSTSYNALGGITAGDGSIVAGNVLSYNGTTAGSHDGLVVLRSSLVIDNASNYNGAAGITALGDSSVMRNLVSGNLGDGLYLSPDSGGSPAAYRENVISGNSMLSVASGLNQGNNACNGTVTCP